MIGIGIDAVDVDRFRSVLARRPSMAQRLFTASELAALEGGKEHDCERAELRLAARLAARFAAKEAVMKALGVGLGAFGFHDVEVLNEPAGAPVLVLSGRAQTLAIERGVASWLLSLTHTATVAEAVAVAL